MSSEQSFGVGAGGWGGWKDAQKTVGATYTRASRLLSSTGDETKTPAALKQRGLCDIVGVGRRSITGALGGSGRFFLV